MKKTYYSGKWYLTIVKNEGEETYCYFDLIKCINNKWGCPASRVGSIEHVLDVIKGYKEIDERPEFENSRELNADNFKMYEEFTEILNKVLEDEADEQNKKSNKSEKEVVNMKSVKNVVKGLLLSCVIVIGCLVNGMNANAVTTTQSIDKNIKDHYTMQNGDMKTVFSDGSFYINSDVEIQSTNWIDNTVTINKDGQLYSFYVDKDSIDSYYLGEMVNITMDKDNNNIIDCNVIDKVIVSSGVIKSVSDEYLTVSVNGCDYKIENDIGANWSVNDKVNTVIQDSKLINISPVK